MDVVYFARAVENYLPYLSSSEGGHLPGPAASDLAHYLLGMIENLLPVRRRLLELAQARDRSCRRLLRAVSAAARLGPEFKHRTDRLATETYSLAPPRGGRQFAGVTCTWYGEGKRDKDSRLLLGGGGAVGRKRVFHCSEAPTASPGGDGRGVSSGGKEVLASVAVPKSLAVDLAGFRGRKFVSRSSNSYLSWAKRIQFCFYIFVDPRPFPLPAVLRRLLQL